MSFLDYVNENFESQFKTLKYKQNKFKRNIKYHSGYLSFDEFEKDLLIHKENIVKFLARNAFRFDYLYPVILPKDATTFRMICVPSVKDRLIQQLILGYLKDEYPLKFNILKSADFASPDRGGAKEARLRALELRNKYKYAIKTDISSFYDNINRKEMFEIFKRKIDILELNDIVEKVIKCDVSITPIAKESRVPEKINFINSKRRKGVRQGMPMSSILASLYLSDFDAILIAKGVPFVRYADDLLLFANKKSEAKKILIDIKVELDKIGLSIPDLKTNTKTRIVGKEPVIFLGLDVLYKGSSYVAVIPDSIFKDLSVKLNKYDSMSKNIKNNLGFSQVIQQINFICNGYMACFDDAENLYVMQKFIESEKKRVYIKILSGLKIDFNALSNRQKKFFFSL